jgi:TrkA domain protein
MPTPSRPARPAAPVVETELPGIGPRYELRAAEGGDVVVVIHHSGRRDLYILDPRGRTTASVTLTDAQARTLGAILGGAWFTPAIVEEMEAVIGDLLIDWVTLPEGAPGDGRSIAELEIRRRTRMSVVAIRRGDESVIAPEPTELLHAGDQLVVVGRQEDLHGFLRHVIGELGDG